MHKYLRVQRIMAAPSTATGESYGEKFSSHSHSSSPSPTSTQVAFWGQSSSSVQSPNVSPSEFTRTAIMSKSRICKTLMLVGFALLVIPWTDWIKAVCIYNVIWLSRGVLNTNQKQSIISCHPSLSNVKNMLNAYSSVYRVHLKCSANKNILT